MKIKSRTILLKKLLHHHLHTSCTVFCTKLTQRILEAHANVKDCNLVEAKMNYIKAWQSLPDFGISLFVVRFNGQKKDELLGVAFNRIMRMESNTGDHLKTWRYGRMKVITKERMAFLLHNNYYATSFPRSFFIQPEELLDFMALIAIINPLCKEDAKYFLLVLGIHVVHDGGSLNI